MRKCLIAGNWKMNGSAAFTDELITAIVAGLSGREAAEVLVCPPFPYLPAVAAKLSGTAVLLGAQNVSQHPTGAYTGEIAADMLKDVGCEYVIVGHSERRAMLGESNEIVAGKFAAAQKGGLKPILCVGETLEQREADRTEQVIGEQLQAVLESSGIAGLGGAVIAYEPVWAIGTGRTATPDQAEQVHRYIRELLAAKDKSVASKTQILYGGSMKGNNAAGLLDMPDIDGGLIGGASLKADEFLSIVAAAASN